MEVFAYSKDVVQLCLVKHCKIIRFIRNPNATNLSVDHDKKKKRLYLKVKLSHF